MFFFPLFQNQDSYVAPAWLCLFWHAQSTVITRVSCNSVTSKVSLNYNLNKHVFNLTVYYYYYYYYHQQNEAQ